MADAPFDLTVSYLTYPAQALITDPQPAFSWALANGVQTAYQLVVTAGEKALWDSGQVKSGQAIGVRYAGQPLESFKSYSWRVRVWTQGSRASAWSTPQVFRTGKLGDWPQPSPENALVQVEGQWLWPNRNPLTVTAVSPQRIVARGDGSVFVDFGSAWFGTLSLTLPKNAPPTTVTVHFGGASCNTNQH